jgi:epoxyqueuosine reductase QueG
MTSDLSRRIKSQAREMGITEVGICLSSALSDNQASMNKMLPGHRSIICVLALHSETALDSPDLHVKKYDTMFTYGEVARVSHGLVRYLETEGHKSLAVPSFLPLDMADDKLGMVGAIDWRRVAGESGLAAWSTSGLAISPRYGPRMRIGGVLTTAELEPDKRLDYSPCEDCKKCIEACPVGALLGEGQIERKRCSENLFSHGLRAFTRLLVDVAAAENKDKVKEIVYSYRTRELWQALETGSYYYCWSCQSACPVGKS